MAKVHGKNLDIALWDGAAYDDISDIGNSVSIEDNTDASEVSNFAGDGWREFIAGLRGGTISLEGFYDAAQWALVLDAADAGEQLIRIRPAGTGSGLPQIVVTVVGFQLSCNFALEDAEAVSISGTISGAIDYTAQ
jgi:hypothetical protein